MKVTVYKHEETHDVVLIATFAALLARPEMADC
jgi:hypothetical protein